jgi:hypothetical protein
MYNISISRLHGNFHYRPQFNRSHHHVQLLLSGCSGKTDQIFEINQASDYNHPNGKKN